MKAKMLTMELLSAPSCVDANVPCFAAGGSRRSWGIRPDNSGGGQGRQGAGGRAGGAGQPHRHPDSEWCIKFEVLWGCAVVQWSSFI